MKSNFILKISLLTLSLSITVFSLTGCYWLWWFIPFSAEESSTELKLVSDAEMTFSFNEETGCYDIRVEGIAENSSGEDLLGAYVSVSIYDGQGNIICVAEEYISEISVGEKWRFCALGSSRFLPENFKITELYGWY